MSSVDVAFVKAITTIKSLSRGQGGLGKPPPPDRRVQLYGLYKQATEGNVDGIMPRPDGDDPQSIANQRKWDAWKSQEGLSKQEAKLEYVGYLLDTMRLIGPPGADSGLPPLWADLEQSYETAKKTPLSAVTQPFPQVRSTAPSAAAGHRRRASIESINSSYSHFLHGSHQRPTFSEFGLSEKDRSELEADRLVDKIQTSYPHMVPGGIEIGAAKWDSYPYIQNLQQPLSTPPLPQTVPSPATAAPIATSGPLPTAAPVPSGDDDTASDNAVADHALKLLMWVYSHLSDVIARLIRRVSADTAWILLILTVIRIAYARPQFVQRMPFLRKTVETLGKVIAVVLNEFGVELRLKARKS